MIGHPGSFANEEANLVELKKVMILCLNSKKGFSYVLCIIYLNLHIPHASKSENMKASTSFIVSPLISLFRLTAHCLISYQVKTGEYSEQIKIVSRTDY